VATALVKPVGDRCNLACSYCFYHPGTGRAGGVMEEEVLAALTRAVLAERASPAVFAWQGGEPTLAGLDFYRRAVDLQRRLASPGQRLGNALQTNGLLIDSRWAAFLAENRFLVGLSIDGPADCHDAVRRSAAGAPSHARAVAAWDSLRRAGCEVNILCVVSRANVDRPADVYAHLAGDLGAQYLQLIPCVEGTPPGARHDASLTPGEYGRFLAAVFDLWAAETSRSVSVKLFDDLVLYLAGRPMRDCMHRPTCDSHLVVERDGSVYPCDFFVGDEHRLGTVTERTWRQLRNTARARAFRSAKQRQRPAECRGCRHLDICQGGCRKFWRPSAGGFTQYLCEDMRTFLDACRGRLEEMARAVQRRWREWRASPGR